MGAALNERIVATRTVQGLTPLYLLDMLEMIERNTFKIDNVDRLRFVTEDTLFILDS